MSNVLLSMKGSLANVVKALVVLIDQLPTLMPNATIMVDGTAMTTTQVVAQLQRFLTKVEQLLATRALAKSQTAALTTVVALKPAAAGILRRSPSPRAADWGLYSPAYIRHPTPAHVEPDQLSRDLASLKIDRNPQVASARGRWVAALVVLAALAGVVYAVYPKVHAALTTAELSLGEVQLISPAQADVQLTATGYVIALTSAKVAAKVAGRIAELFVDTGSVMQKGDKVARLDDVDFKSNMAASASRAAAARAKIAIAKAQLAEIKVQIDREKPMVENGVSSTATLADLQTRADSLTASVQAAQADAEASDAETTALKTQLGSYTIVTPISGTVVNKLVQVGEGVSPGFGTPGVVDVVDMTSLVIEVDVPESRLAQVVIGGPCEIVLDAYATKRWRGQVKEIIQRVNRSKATVPVRVTFVDRPETVLPDMAARVSFLATALDPQKLAAPPKLVVPGAAVVQRSGADVVFVYDDGEVRQKTVDLIDKTGDLRELRTQLPVGTKVVLSPPATLADGQNVKEKK